MPKKPIRKQSRKTCEHCGTFSDEVTLIEVHSMCTNCSGTGEGQWDGSTCVICKGTGENVKEQLLCPNCESNLD